MVGFLVRGVPVKYLTKDRNAHVNTEKLRHKLLQVRTMILAVALCKMGTVRFFAKELAGSPDTR